MRLFVALELPAATRADLETWSEQVAPAGVRRVPVVDLHLTLAFLGTRSAEEAALVGDLLVGVAAAHPAGTLTTAGALWLATRRAGVLTVALVASEELVALRAAVVSALVGAIAYRPETRPFRPHVTVGRVPSTASVREVQLDPPPALAFRAEALTLYRTRTAADGARYEVLARVALD